MTEAAGTPIPSPQEVNQLKQNIIHNPIKLQGKVLQNLLEDGYDTVFGNDHSVKSIATYTDFKNQVPVREHEDYDKYWQLLFSGAESVLAPGKPIYLARTSASTGYPKYIPITTKSIKTFINMPVMSILQFMHDTNNFDLLNYHSLSLTGVTSISQHMGYPTGSISGFTRNCMPDDLAKKALPSKAALDLMASDDWEAMFRQAAKEAVENPISICTGLPSWMIQFFNICCDVYATKDLTRIFPQLKLLCTSGVNYRPYLPQLQQLFNHKLQIREFYAASEGAFAYQDSEYNDSMLLNIADGIYFEFIELAYANFESPPRLNLEDVRVGVSYVPVITTNAGLWAYKLGDIIEFSSVEPFRIKVVGRTKHFISIVAEHVYAQNVESAVQSVSTELDLEISNFTVAPNQAPDNKLPYYDWFIETKDNYKIDNRELAFRLDYYLNQVAKSYADRRRDSVLGRPRVHFVKPGAFLELLKQKDTTSLQLKVPKLANDREIADFLYQHNLVLESEEVVA